MAADIRELEAERQRLTLEIIEGERILKETEDKMRRYRK
jgi:hypothetical protein